MQYQPMVRGLTRYWWAFALRGVFAVLFGIVALGWPEITLLVLVIVFRAYAVVDGALKELVRNPTST